MLAAVTLAACGGSSNNANASSQAATSSSASQGATGASRFAAIRSCLEKQGVKLPSAPSGGRPPGGFGSSGSSGGPPAGGAQLPGGTSRTQFQEAMKKCGAGNFRGGRFNGAASKAALEKYAACMRENGVNLPNPNTSGNGPVFNTQGIDTNSSAFKAAQSKCRSDLPGAFGGGARGGMPPGGPSGAAPSGEPGGGPPP